MASSAVDEPQHAPGGPQQDAGDDISRANSTSAAEVAVSQLLGMTGMAGDQDRDSNGHHAQDSNSNGAGHGEDDAAAAPSAQDQDRYAGSQSVAVAAAAAATMENEGDGDSRDRPADSDTAAINSHQHHDAPPPESQPQPQQQTHSYTGATPAATAGGNGNGLPTCQNCSTSTTPLWRRDEYGSVLCNACGLFLKLHGRPRPISLKTDVIKSRNRVKTMRPDMAKKKNTTPSQNQNARKHSGAGHPDGPNDSPISRTGTPSMYHNTLPSFIMEDPYTSATGAYGASGANGDGSGSPMNDTPQTHEQLIANNSSLKTRVRELELINELFRGRLSQLEQQEAAARHGSEVAGAEQTQLRSQLEASQALEKQLAAQLDDSHRRENSLKRRLDELELELKDAKDAAAAATAAAAAAVVEGEENSDRPAKRTRTQGPDREAEQVEEAKAEAVEA